jgi:hypothetical protein
VRGDHDGGEFVCFEKEWFDESLFQQFTLDDQLKPIDAFAGFFNDNSQFGDELRL